MARKPRRRHADDLRGATRLAAEATRGVTEVVEAMHLTIASGPAILGRPLERPVRLITAAVYGSIRGVTKLVGSSLDAALARLDPLLGESAPGPERAALLGVLNGVLGDHLAASGNPLATEMSLCHGGHPLELERRALAQAVPGAGARVLVLVHGSCMNDRQWAWHGHDHGAALAQTRGYVPLYLRYNSGLHVSTNGRALAALLERLVSEWPVPIAELAILGHSMGGLVARSACHAGDESGHAWRAVLRRLVCLGSPHHGAVLERGGNGFEVLLGVSHYSAPLARLGRLRSAGVTDLRFGNVIDEHWDGRDRFAFAGDPRKQLALPAGVQCFAIAGSLTPAATGGTGAHRALRGDGLVAVESALGQHARPELTLAFPDAHRRVAMGTGHLDLLSRPEVFEILKSWLGP